jgi:O-antigen/teichoic acid export membrane protein
MSGIARLFRNISSNYVKVGVDGVITIALTPFVVQQLGVAQYAVWLIAGTIGYYLGFLDLGVSDAQVQRHSMLQAQGAKEAIGRLHGTVLTLFAAAGAVALALSVGIAALPTAALFDVPLEFRNPYIAVLPLVGLGLFVSFLESAVNGIFEGYQRYDLMNAVDIVLAVAGAAATYAVLQAGYGMTGVAWVLVAGGAAALVAKLVVVGWVFPAHAFPRLGFDRESWNGIRGFTFWNSLTDIVTEGTANLDKLLIPIFLGSALVTPYALVLTVAALVFLVAEPISNTFFPIASHCHGRGDRTGLGVLLTRGSRLVNTVTLPATVVLLCFGTTILDVWIGAEIVDVEPALLWFTVLSFYFSTYLWTSLSVLMGSGQARAVFWMALLEVAIALALLLVLVPAFGLTGFALAGLISNVGTGLALFAHRACRLAGVNYWRFLRSTLLSQILAVLPSLAFGLWLARTVRPDSLLALALCAVATGFVGLACVVVVAGRWQRARYVVVLGRILPPLVRYLR